MKSVNKSENPQLSRRDFLAVSALFGAAATPLVWKTYAQASPYPNLLPQSQPKDGKLEDLIGFYKKQGVLPIIDVHSHIDPDVTLAEIIRKIDEAGVVKIGLMALSGATDEKTITFYKGQPTRIIPFIAFQVEGWRDQRVLYDMGVPSHRRRMVEGDVERKLHFFYNEVKKKAESGRYAALGEVILRHYAWEGIRAMEFSIPADSEYTTKFADLAAKHKMPMTIHLEA